MPRTKTRKSKKIKKNKLKEFFVNTITLIITFLVIFIILEIGTRVIKGDETVPGDWPQDSKVYIPELKRTMYHDVSNLRRTTNEYDYLINTNKEGFRDFHNISKANNSTRILVLGDSMTFGNTVNLEDSYPYLLERKFNKSRRKTEVINLGVGGFGTAEEYIVLSKYGLKYKPDIILVGFYINDFKDSLNYERRNPEEKSLFRIIFSKSKFLNWLYWKLKLSSIGNAFVNKFKLNMDQQDEFEFELSLLDKTKQNNSDVKESISIVFDSFNRIKELADENNIKLLVFYIPSDYQIHPERLNKIIEIRQINITEPDIDYAQSILASYFKENKVTFVDFTETYRQNNNTDMYWFYDRHLNKEGYSFLAELLYNETKKLK